MRCCSISPNGEFIVSGGIDNTVRVWNVDSGSINQVLRASNIVTCCTVSSDNESIVAGSVDGVLTIWRGNNQRKFLKLDNGAVKTLYCQL